MGFRGIKPGSTVRYWQYAGMGRGGPQFKEGRGKAVLVFPTHVVIDIGGPHGTPQVVDKSNYIRGGARKAPR